MNEGPYDPQYSLSYSDLTSHMTINSFYIEIGTEQPNDPHCVLQLKLVGIY